MKLLTWLEFYDNNKEGKTLNEVVKEYELYLYQYEQPFQPTYDFLIHYYQVHHKNGGGIIETEPIQPKSGFILQENGDYLLQENGDRFYL